MKRLIAGLLLALAWVVAPADDGVLRRGLAVDPPSLDPTVGSATAAAPVLSDLVEGLVIRGPGGEPRAGCASDWRVSEDGLTYTFTLRDGLQWSDGQALDADDFVYSFRRLFSPDTASPVAGLFFVIDGARETLGGADPAEVLGVAAPDARTVTIRLAAPAPYFIQLLANTQAIPVPRHAIERHGRDWTRPGNMVTNGPFMLAERVPQVSIRLVRNPRFYAADDVALDEVIWLPSPDLGGALRRFRSGELDTVLNFSPDDLPWVRENLPEALRLAPIQATYLMVFNTRRPPFDDVRVRRALSLAIDRDAIADKLLKTGVRPAVSLVTPGTGGYVSPPFADFAQPLAERQAQARELLAEAGFGSDQQLTVPLIYDSQEENRKIAIALEAMWQAVGVNTEGAGMEFRAVLQKMRAGDFALARTAVFAVFDDPYAFMQVFGSRNPRNMSGYRSDAFDEQIAAANATGDPVRRMALLQEAELTLMADQPLLPIYWYAGRMLISERVAGWQDAPLGTPMSRYLSVRDIDN